MLRLVKYLIFGCIFVKAAPVDDLRFDNRTELFNFLKEWSNAESSEDVREKHGKFMMKMMNTSMDPCDDFYNFACGNYGTVCPGNLTHSDSIYGLLFSAQNYIQNMLCESDISQSDSETSSKVKIFYQSCVDRSSFHIDELSSFIRNFAAWPILKEGEASDDFDWLNVTALSAQFGTFALFSHKVYVANNKYSAQFQGLGESKLNVTKLKKIANELSIDLNGKEEELEAVVEFVRKLNKLKAGNLPKGGGLFFDWDELSEMIPEIDLRRYLEILRDGKRVSSSEAIVLQKPVWFEELSAFIHETDPLTIANYVFARWLQMAEKMSERQLEERRKKHCHSLVEKFLKPPLMALYAEAYFDNDAYLKAMHLTDEIHTVACDIVNDTLWFTEETRSKALEKISIIQKKVGFPSYMLPSANLSEEYQDLQLDRDNFVKNYFNTAKMSTLIQESRVGRISEDFLGDPLKPGALYRHGRKGLVEVTATILQPPLYHKYSPNYVKYGGLGFAIGHEFMHGFDVEGILYDEGGAKGIWWDPKISSTYYTRAACYYSQYEQYRLEQINRTVDTEKTIAENVADNQGLKLALTAYKKSLMENEEFSNIEYNGETLSPIQAFFLSFAQFFCGKYTDLDMNFAITNDSHAPSPFRVLGSLANSADFAEAFNCPMGSPMNPEEKCHYLRK